MTSGKWLSVLLRLFQWLARRAISLSYLDFRLQRPESRPDACHQCKQSDLRSSRRQFTLQYSAWPGWTSKSRSVALQVLHVQGSTSTSASRSRSVRNTLLPTPGTVQVCGSSAIAIALALHLHQGLHSHSLLPVDLKNKVCPLSLHYT